MKYLLKYQTWLFQKQTAPPIQREIQVAREKFLLLGPQIFYGEYL